VVRCLPRRLLTLVVLLAASSAARAETPAAQPAVSARPPAPERVPDASLRAVSQRTVRLELDATPAVEGRLLGFEDASVTIARTTTNEVITIARERVLRVVMIDEAPAPAVTAVVAATAPERMRVVALQMSLLGTVAVDAEYKRLRAFASTSLLLPAVTASGGNTWFAGAVGAGMSLPLGNSRWKLDVFGQALPFRTTSFYTYLGFGVGAGAHYTAASGFTVGVTFPVLGFSTRVGSSPYGYDASFRYNDSLAYYYAAGLAGMPLLTMGYRFSTNCPRGE
jgi:hypothetical protein